MKTTEDIIAQFDDIPGMPVSEEILGAYLEGNLPEDEAIAIDSLIAENTDFADFVSGIEVSDTEVSDPYAIDLGDYSPMYTGEEAFTDIGYGDADDFPTHLPETSDLPDLSDLSDFTDSSDTSDLSDLSGLF